MLHIKLAGKDFHMTREDILNALRGVHPLPAHDFSVRIEGKTYPIKQAISVVTGLSSEKFAGSEAHEFLRRLGFVVEHYEQRHRKLPKRKHLDF